MDPTYLKAKLEDVRCYEEPGAPPTADEDRDALLGALVALGLPEEDYVRDPSRPRDALYLGRGTTGRHELDVAPWRFARRAPAGMPPADVREAGRDLRRGLVWSLVGVAASCLVALAASLLARVLAPAATPESLSPAAYLQAAPVLAGCVAILCVLAAVWHGWTLLSPRAALLSAAESRKAWRDPDLSKRLPADRPSGTRPVERPIHHPTRED